MPELFGLDLPVYFAVIIIGTPIYFFWRWVFKKSRHETSTKVAIWIATILAAPIIYCSLIMIWAFITQYYPNHDFDSQQWFANKLKRYEYSKNIIQSEILIGRSPEQVTKILGAPDDYSASNDDFAYSLGKKPDLTPTDYYMFVYFQKGKVVNVVEGSGD